MATAGFQNTNNANNSGNALDFSQMKDSFSKYIVTPLNAFGLGGFIFSVEGETTIDLRANITDHYLENNEPVQDHMSIQPQRVRLTSYVGELVYELDTTINTPLQKVVQKLTTIESFLPVLSKGAAQIKDTLQLGALSFKNRDLSGFLKTTFSPPVLNNIVDLWALTKNLNPAASKQQQAYLYFKALMERKILVSLQTPFEFVTNMMIEGVTATQEEETRSVSNFSITLKKIRTTSVQTTGFNPEQYQGRGQQQSENLTQQGTTQGTDIPLSSPLVDLGKVFGFAP